jgi:trehalose/maltose hydrolase-like predicted phosphorylase
MAHRIHEANFRYYEPRTAHGSSLSPAFYALVAARLGDRALAQAYFRQAAEIDLANNIGNAAGGVHMAALGALWQAAVFGVAGLRLRENGIVLDPPSASGLGRNGIYCAMARPLAACAPAC